MSDSLWERIEAVLPKLKSRFRGRGRAWRNIGGRPAADPRAIVSNIQYILRTPASGRPCRASMTRARPRTATFNAGCGPVFKRLWQAGLGEYDELKGIDWTWQAADGAMTTAPLGGEKTGQNPTDRSKTGTKRSLRVDAQGVPLVQRRGVARHHVAPRL